MKNKAASSQSSFHSKLVELEKIYHLIQDGDDKDLETIIKLYEKGMKLAASLEASIAQYEMRIEEVQKGHNAKTESEAPALKTKSQEEASTVHEQKDTEAENTFELFSPK